MGLCSRVVPAGDQCSAGGPSLGGGAVPLGLPLRSESHCGLEASEGCPASVGRAQEDQALPDVLPEFRNARFCFAFFPAAEGSQKQVL